MLKKLGSVKNLENSIQNPTYIVLLIIFKLKRLQKLQGFKVQILTKFPNYFVIRNVYYVQFLKLRLENSVQESSHKYFLGKSKNLENV